MLWILTAVVKDAHVLSELGFVRVDQGYSLMDMKQTGDNKPEWRQANYIRMVTLYVDFIIT